MQIFCLSANSNPQIIFTPYHGDVLPMKNNSRQSGSQKQQKCLGNCEIIGREGKKNTYYLMLCLYYYSKVPKLNNISRLSQVGHKLYNTKCTFVYEKRAVVQSNYYKIHVLADILVQTNDNKILDTNMAVTLRRINNIK
jgi:hypothetical protein